MNPNGSGVTNITSNRSLSEADPAVSPNGRKIAYEYDREVWVMNADGTGKRRVAGTGGDGDASPSWSPDGKKIVFIKNRDIWVINADGTGQANLTKTSTPDECDPAHSPDGTRIVYQVSPVSGGTQIYVMNANGKNQTNLTPERPVDCPNGGVLDFGVISVSPSWSPNGRRIVFADDAGCGPDGTGMNGRNIWVMNPDGSGKRRLTHDDDTDDTQPAYSPDGTKIVFASDRAGNFSYEIYTMNADGSGIRRLTTNSALDGHPDWQPLR
jgi:TolB protein